MAGLRGLEEEWGEPCAHLFHPSLIGPPACTQGIRPPPGSLRRSGKGGGHWGMRISRHARQRSSASTGAISFTSSPPHEQSPQLWTTSRARVWRGIVTSTPPQDAKRISCEPVGCPTIVFQGGGAVTTPWVVVIVCGDRRTEDAAVFFPSWLMEGGRDGSIWINIV